MSEVATPNPNSVNFALEKKALIVTGSEMPTFFTVKLKVPGGNPDPDAAWLVRFGGSRKIGGVTITTVALARWNLTVAVNASWLVSKIVGGICDTLNIIEYS